jgi:hypothetical protein
MGAGEMWGLFDRKKRQPIAVKACRITWHYEHPPGVLAFHREACTRAFATWVLTVCDAEAITRRQLVSMYAEFCEVHQVRPMAWGRFDRSLRPSGFQRHRLSSPGRPWVYRIAGPGSAIVYKTPPPAAVQAPQQRRAAA